jgi:hypothetical protein
MTIYVVVNEYERTKFEKVYQIPFGYGCAEHIKLFVTEKLAKEFKENQKFKGDWIIEKITSGVREIIN